MGRVMTLDEARTWRAGQGGPIVLTNGHFDLLHVGHVRYLQAARKPGRPLVPQADRAELLAALGCVDAVVIFDALTANELVTALRPDIYVKGGDWGRPDGPQPPEAELVTAQGGQVVYLPYVPDRSTTLIIQRIRALPAE